MPIIRFRAEPIVTLPRQIEVGIANGKPTPQAYREADITMLTYHRERKQFGNKRRSGQTSQGT